MSKRSSKSGRHQQSRFVCFNLILLASAHTVCAARGPKIEHVRVRFLATSALVRSSWTPNEDIYLVELRPDVNSASVLARLVDQYPNLFAPLPRQILTAVGGTPMRVRRDASCDIPFGHFILRTRPGDPNALLHERLGYNPELPFRPGPDTVVPCYRIVRFHE